jgi:hypothetical protein
MTELSTQRTQQDVADELELVDWLIERRRLQDWRDRQDRRERRESTVRMALFAAPLVALGAMFLWVIWR